MTIPARPRRWTWILIAAADAGIVLYGLLAVATPAMMAAGYESYSGSPWAALGHRSPAISSYLLLLYRLVGGLNVALGLALIAITVGPYRRGARWAWLILLVGNAIGFGAPITYDQVTGAIGTFEVLELLAVGMVVLALVLSLWRPRIAAQAIEAAILKSTFWHPKWLCTAHTWLYRRTRGRVSGQVEGFPVLLLTTMGRRSGHPRTTPLLYAQDGEDLVVVNSDEHPPNWWRNLRQRPEATARMGRSIVQVEGHAADADEQARLWPWLSARNQLWRRHQAQTGRAPLIVILRPLRAGRSPRLSVGSSAEPPAGRSS